MTLPPNSLNQVIQQAFSQKNLARIGIDLDEVFGDKGGMFEYSRELVHDIEYVDGVLILTYSRGMDPELTMTKMIPWARIRSIYWDHKDIPSRVTFSNGENYIVPAL